MADEEQINEQTDAAPAAPEAEAAGDVASEAAAAAAADDVPEAASDADEVVPAGPQPSRREQRTAARHAEASKRPRRSPEERAAERIDERARKAAQRRRRRAKEKLARPEQRGPAKTVSSLEHGPGRPKVRQGLVVSDRADKTITVRIESARRHRRYEKIVRSSSTLHAHDESNDAHTGDLVRVVESRPLSATKRWRLLEVLERAR